LRGPQTPGELRGRTERLHSFAEIADVLAGLQKLTERTPSLAAVLPRQPGTKESRYTHLLCGPVESVAASFTQPAYSAPIAGQDQPTIHALISAQAARIAQLESTVAELQNEVAAVRSQVETLRGY
jgi:uncharacterized protein YceH (UPF0502 family)